MSGAGCPFFFGQPDCHPARLLAETRPEPFFGRLCHFEPNPPGSTGCFQNITNMPHFNERTGRKRRRTTWETSRNNRIEALDAADVVAMRTIQNRIYVGIHSLIHALIPFMQSILFNTLGLIDPNVGDVLIYICSVCVNVIDLFIQINLQFDSALVDIEPEDELTRAHSCKPRINCALDNYSASQVKQDTNFLPSEIRTLINFFDLPIDEDIEIESGEGTGHFYHFTSEELLLFVLKKLKSGASNTDMVRGDFGGDARKWSQAMSWFLNRADAMIQNHTSLNMIQRYRNLLPLWAEKISERISKGFHIQHENGVREFVPGKLFSLFFLFF